MTITFAEIPLKKILDSFATGFTPPEGKTLHHYESFFDPQKGVVVFKLFLESSDGLIVLPDPASLVS